MGLLFLFQENFLSQEISKTFPDFFPFRCVFCLKPSGSGHIPPTFPDEKQE